MSCNVTLISCFCIQRSNFPTSFVEALSYLQGLISGIPSETVACRCVDLFLVFSVWFPWSPSLFPCPHRTGLILTVPSHVLKSGSVRPQGLLLLFTVTLSIQLLLCFHMTFMILFSRWENYALDVLNRTPLNM